MIGLYSKFENNKIMKKGKRCLFKPHFLKYLYTLMAGSKGQTPIHDTYGWLEEHMPMSTMAAVGASLSQLFVDIRTLHLL